MPDRTREIGRATRPTDDRSAGRGMTPAEVARRYRVSPDKVRSWISTGALSALNIAETRVGRPRYIVLPAHLSAFEAARAATPPPKPARRKRATGAKDFFPD